MVQTPFSETRVDNTVAWRNTSLQPSDELMFSGHAQVKKKLHKMQRSKVSTILSSVDTGNCGKSAYSKFKSDKKENMLPNELRLTRNTLNHSVTRPPAVPRPPPPPPPRNAESVLFPLHSAQVQDEFSNKSYSGEIAVDTFYKMPTLSNVKTLSSNDAHNIPPEIGSKDTIVIPNSSSRENSSALVKGIFIANSELKVKPSPPPTKMQSVDVSAELEGDRVDYLIQAKSLGPASVYSYNVSVNVYSCTSLPKSKADIDAQQKFIELDIEPTWIWKKHYWNHIFDSRYETLMRNPNWPPLKVILIPRSHVDSIWKKTFERYHNDSVHKIISNAVKKLQFYRNLTFHWNEVSHLSHWWKTTTSKSRSTLRRLIKDGRLEITTGGWVETDEATTHVFGLIHQLVEGQQWLKDHLSYLPSVGWLTNSVAHSPTMAYLLSASGISNLVITNVHFSWEEFFAEYQYSDFIWLQNWRSDSSVPSSINMVLGRIGGDRLPKHSVLTHIMQFNSAGFTACGPHQAICVSDFNFVKSSQNPEIYTYNVKEKSELLLEQYSKTGTVSSHNTIIAPIGGPYNFEKQAEFDYQYNNYQKLADYINSNRDIYKASIDFGTPKDYFNTVLKKHKAYPTLRGDFLNFADLNSGKPAYWTGYFTSRPLFKILLRRLQSTLRSTEILFAFAINLNAFHTFDTTGLFELLIKAREMVARLQDRNVVSGTLTSNSIKYAYKQILLTVKNCWYIQEVTASLLSVKPDRTILSPYLQKFVYRDGEFVSGFKTVGPGDQVYVFNSLSHERTEVVELIVRTPNIRIIDHNKKEVTIQINPVWKYNSDNIIRISRRFYKVTFAIVVPPMTLELYRIKETYDGAQNAATIYCVACVVDDIPGEMATFPFHIQRIQTGDIQLESYKFRLVIDEHTGFLKHVIEKATGAEKTVVIDYGAFKSSDINSGMFLFNTNITKPLRDILMPYRIGMKTNILMIVSGQVVTELTSIYGRLLQSTFKIFNLLNSPLSNAIFVESKVDYEVSPKNRELEIFLSIQTDIANGNIPEIFTDSNGFQYTARLLNLTRRIESNVYPMTTMSFLQDHRTRLTVITDHAQGVTALQEGQLVVMLDRRVLFNDGRGSNEGLADSSATCHRHIILLENFVDHTNYYYSRQLNLQLPSLSAIHLSGALDYQLDVFIIEKNKTDHCYYAFLPLVKTSFPCDVSLINYRVVFKKGSLMYQTPNTALMILHRQSVSCHTDYDVQLYCNGDNNFSLDKILHNVKSVYQTNLSGTKKGVPISSFNDMNFPAMELTTVKIHF
ncbi:alpha-mannosidase 2-like isoform X1 [Pectinophora gossypiella]|uniref:alpha-mannosidase 2-like isoform X1 n=1 Tax=Pectinophora gossypiella TaxID=13191 RepID=UPI00214E0378|nr:alpha-mannosidase 2-like isoform X1 [Pectinophora gossypiella]XP_049886313.1 alpha-mannosidase 2-like isoform X1 [Pectinophora gossypiella]